MLYERFVGRSSEPVHNVVDREAVRLFAEAIADPSPLYRDEDAGGRSRYGRLLAPPTFPRGNYPLTVETERRCLPQVWKKPSKRG